MEDCVNETVINPSNTSVSSHTETLNHVINDIALPTVCAFGIVGNILNLTILTRRKLQKSFRSLEQAANLCLIALAVSDLMFCILALLTTFTPPDNVYDQQGVTFFYGLYSYFFINVFIMESTMLTVAMSLERYMAICFPLRQDLYLTTRRIKYLIVSTFIFSLLFNIPVIWRFEAHPLCTGTSFDGISKVPSSSNNATLSKAVNHSNELMSNLSGKVFTSNGSTVHNVYTAPWSSSTSPSPSASPLQLPFKSSTAAAAAAAAADLPAPSDDAHLLPVTNIRKSSESPFSIGNASTSSPVTPIPSPRQPPTRYKIQETRGKQTEKMAYRIAWAIVGNVIPLILLFFFNVCLCRKIYLSYKMRRQFKRQSRAKSSSHILTLTLVVIVVMFFILVAPSELLLLVSNTSTTVEPILNFMQSLNFSVNFILYCIISPHFRKTLKYIFLCGCYNIYQVSRDWKKEFETSLM